MTTGIVTDFGAGILTAAICAVFFLWGTCAPLSMNSGISSNLTFRFRIIAVSF